MPNYIGQKWTAGWGNGLTGPRTPNPSGPDVNTAIQLANRDRAMREWRDNGGQKPAYPAQTYMPVSIGMDTIAICVGESIEVSKAHAEHITKCVNGLPVLLQAIREYRYWFDTCTRTAVPGWQEAADKASAGLDEAIQAVKEELRV